MNTPRRTPSSRRQFPLTAVNLRLLMALAILFIDVVLLATGRLAIHGAVDETAHILTALLWGVLALAVGLPVSLSFVALGGVFPDLDHIPTLFLGVESLPGSSRSVLHTLLVVLVFLALARWQRSRRWIWGSLALGVASHLVRDMATGTVILFWPVSGRPFSVPYLAYMGTLAICVLLPAFMPRRAGGTAIDTSHQPPSDSATAERRRQAGEPHPRTLPDAADLDEADAAIVDRPHPRETAFVPIDQRR